MNHNLKTTKMIKCKKCGDKFEIPKFAIDMAYAIYCQKCIKEGLIKISKMPLDEYIKLTAKQIGL